MDMASVEPQARVEPQDIAALRLIAARCTGPAATAAIGALQSRPPRAATYAARAAGYALADSAVQWTHEERVALAALLGPEPSERRGETIPVRVSPEEKDRVRQLAADAGFASVSEFVRDRLGLS